MKNMNCYIGIDLGGTTVKIGLLSGEGDILEKREISTRVMEGYEIIFGDIAAGVRDIAENNRILLKNCQIGMGIPGPVEESGFVESMVNLNMYNIYPGRILSGLLDKKPIAVANDANVAALGEMWQGCGKGCKSVIMVTLGTGVGSGIVINGNILYGAHGLAGEIGHTWVNPDEPEPCNCGGHGCLDQMASATGIVRNAKRFLEKTQKDSILRSLENLTAKAVFDAAKEKDEVAESTIDYCMGFLGKSLADVSYVIDPEIVIIGGGVSKAGKYLLDIVYRHYRRYPKLKDSYPEFSLAELGSDAGIYGAARLAMAE